MWANLAPIDGSGLLPADAIPRAHGHHLLNGLFGIFGEVSNFDASGLLVPFENLRVEDYARFTIRAIGPFNEGSFAHRHFLLFHFRYSSYVKEEPSSQAFFLRPSSLQTRHRVSLHIWQYSQSGHFSFLGSVDTLLIPISVIPLQSSSLARGRLPSPFYLGHTGF
jgi:hypothetical protein